MDQFPNSKNQNEIIPFLCLLSLLIIQTINLSRQEFSFPFVCTALSTAGAGRWDQLGFKSLRLCFNTYRMQLTAMKPSLSSCVSNPERNCLRVKIQNISPSQRVLFFEFSYELKKKKVSVAPYLVKISCCSFVYNYRIPACQKNMFSCLSKIRNKL